MPGNSMARRPVIFIGATDSICREAVRLFAGATDAPIILAGSDGEATKRLTVELGRQNITARDVNLFNADELRKTIAGAALVVQGAQPYHQTTTPVLKACIDAHVPYLDYSDDVHSTQESLDLHEQAKRESVPCYINCGASPGMSNLMAAQICAELDTVDSLDISWLVSDEGAALGREVLEHLMHITGGPCPTWEGGKATVHENWVERQRVPLKPGVDIMMHESVHPEPITLPRRFPEVSRIRTLGALSPAPFNGFARGLGAAVHSGALSMDDAVDFLANLQKKPPSGDETGPPHGGSKLRPPGGETTLKQLFQQASGYFTSLKPWRLAIGGMLEQVRRGDCSTSDVVKFLTNSATGKKAPYQAGIAVRGVGSRGGRPAVVIKRDADAGLDAAFGESMATVIGCCCAAFALQVLDLGGSQTPGVHCPEDWSDLESFYKYVERVSKSQK